MLKRDFLYINNKSFFVNRDSPYKYVLIIESLFAEIIIKLIIIIVARELTFLDNSLTSFYRIKSLLRS